MANWEGVTEFVAVAETGGFTSAAERLGISTAQVSRQVGALEARLAIRLFYRTTRKVTITEPGQVYYNHCRQLLDGLDEAERAVTDLHQTPRGRLKMTAPVTYGEREIAPLVTSFMTRYPDLVVNLTLTNRMLDLVAESYDLAIRLGHLEDSSLIAKQLSSRSNHVCAAPAYLEEHGAPRTLGELEQHNCLRGTPDHWRFQEGGRPRPVRVSGSLRCNSGWALVDAALRGIGIIQLPDYYVQAHLDAGRLVPLLAEYSPPDEGIWAIYPPNRHLSPKVRLLLAHLAQNLTPLTPGRRPPAAG